MLKLAKINIFEKSAKKHPEVSNLFVFILRKSVFPGNPF